MHFGRRAAGWGRGLRAGVVVGVAAGLSWAAGLSGCASDPTRGYALSSSYDTAVRTVHVPIFKNPTFSRGLEADLTEAVIKEIQAATPWRVVGSRDAETELTGTIVDARLRSLSTDRRTGLAQELDVELTVDFEWRDRRSGKVLVARKSFTASEAFAPASPVQETLESGQFAAVQRLARDIVTELRGEW